MDPIKILLVDDSKSARYALRLQLQRHGVTVDTADSAEAALERIAETPPDAVLMDHTMPGMNGFEALEIIKSDPATDQIPVVMCTSHDDPVYAAQALKRGALTVLTKAAAPEKLPMVLEQIRAVLSTGAEMPVLAGEPTPELGLAQAPPAPTPPSTPIPTRAEVDEWIEARLTQRLSEAVEAHLAKLTTDLRRVIAEQVEMAVDALPPPAIEPHLARLTTEMRQAVAEQVRVAVDALPPPPPAPQIDLEVLRSDIVPAEVRRHFDAERDAILQLMQQCVQEHQGAQAEDPEVLDRLLKRADESVATQTARIVREETETAVAAALAEHRETLTTLQRGLKMAYGLGAAGLLLGAAALVLVLLI